MMFGPWADLYFCLFVISTLTNASPWPTWTRLATHGSHLQRRNVKIQPYFPKSNYQTYGSNGVPHHSRSLKRSLHEDAFDFIKKMTGVESGNLGFRSGFEDEHSSYAYIRLYHNGIPFVNSIANVAYKGEKVVSFGNSFIDISKVSFPSSVPTVDWPSLTPQLEEDLDAKFKDQPKSPSLAWFVQDDDSVALVHVLQFQDLDNAVWFEAYVDAHSGKVLSATNFVADASYTATNFRTQPSMTGLDIKLATFADPSDTNVSPAGWHTPGAIDTSGNNVGVFFENEYFAKETSPEFNFNANYDSKQPVNSPGNVDASITNVFYVTNMMHDFAYRYGFTERAANFQHDNFGKGGVPGDEIYIQLGNRTQMNNAHFLTGPDGEYGVAQFFYFNQTNTLKDSSMDNSVVIHEITHGISNRMTGGGSARCLQAREASGMGEGWSDMMANWMFQTSSQTVDMGLGQWLTGTPHGVRSFVYSTQISVNPTTYSWIRDLDEEHHIGEVWANMLHGVYADLVAARGYADDAIINPNGSGGNTVFMHLMMDGWALQPCNPTFTAARNAMIQADINRYNGINRCLLWRSFARRGLGYRADDTYVDDFHVPADCLDDYIPQR